MLIIVIRVGWEHILAMQTYSARFRAYRKAMQPYLGSESAVAQSNSLQEVEAHRFLLRVLKDQKNLSKHIQTYVRHPSDVQPLTRVKRGWRGYSQNRLRLHH